MQQLARAIVHLAGFLETCEDDVVDPDVAIDCLQGISHHLQDASPAELEAVRAAAAERAARAEGEAKDFYEKFMEYMGLEDLPEEDEDDE